ncbi:hypothetical protein Trydic_g23935 [Trypoxylus dichotomus]
MIPKKDKDKKDGEGKKQELPFQSVVYVTDRVSTMIDLLDSPEVKVLLRVIGTLNRSATNNDIALSFMVNCGIFPKLIKLLQLEDIYTTRFTLSMIEKVVTRPEMISRIRLADLFVVANSVKEKYLKLRDDIIRTLSTVILLYLAKSNTRITEHIYSLEVISKIMEILKDDKDLNLAANNLQLLFYMLDANRAEKEVIHCEDFSIQLLMCLLDSGQEMLRYWSVHILHKIAMWKISETLIILGREKMMQAMMKLILDAENLNYSEICFEAIYISLSEVENAEIFVKTLEFVRFLEWVKTSPKVLIGPSSMILKSLSDHENLLQVLFDFSAEVSAVSLFRHLNESVILNVCDVIINMMRHKYCMESMASTHLMKILVEIAHDDRAFATIPYGEKAMLVLHRFFQYHVNTAKYVYESGSMGMLMDIFEKAKSKMTKEGYLRMIQIVQHIVKSKYSHAMMDIGTIQLIITLYSEATFEETMIMTIMESFLENNEFREIFLERNGLDVMMEKIRKRKSIESSTQVLLALKKLLTYSKVGRAFVDGGYISQLRYFKENLKFNTPIVEEIIEMIYDFCLTLKFFYKKRLDENDRIRDQFILIPDAICAMPLSAFNVKANKLSDRFPIYTVLLRELVTLEQESKAKSIMDVSQQKQRLFAGSFARGTGTNEDQPSRFRNLIDHPAGASKNSDEAVSVVMQSDWCAEDTTLAKVITNIYEEIHQIHPCSYEKIPSRVSLIAFNVNNFLSNWYMSHIHPRHAFEFHIRKLIRKSGSNFIPIGRLKLGNQCERALMFKVICDQTKVPTTLCKEGDSYFNEISLFGNNKSSSNGPMIQKRFIVDLMENIGTLIPQDSQEAELYLRRNRTHFC